MFVFFAIYGQFAAFRKPDSRHMVYNTYVFFNSNLYLVKHKNRTLCLYLHTKFQVCSIGQTSFRQTVGKEGLGSAPNPTAKQTSKKLALIRVVTHPKNFDSLHSWSIGRPKLIHQLLILQCNTQSRSTLPVAIVLGSLILKKENILALYVKLVDVR